MAATITVAGSAVVPASPDNVELGITLTQLEQTPADAINVVARRTDELQTLFAEMGIGKRQWTTSGVSVNAEQEWDGKRQVHRGYRARARVQVRLDDASAVGKLLQEAVTRVQAQIDGPSWVIAPTNPAHQTARTQAAIAARAKAEDYASALGARLGAIQAVAEPGLLPEPSVQLERSAMKAMAYAPEADMTVNAGDLQIAATVHVTFALEQ